MFESFYFAPTSFTFTLNFYHYIVPILYIVKFYCTRLERVDFTLYYTILLSVINKLLLLLLFI